MKTGGASKQSIGLAGEVRRLAWCRCRDEENRKEGRRSVMPVAMPGMSAVKNKKESMGTCLVESASHCNFIGIRVWHAVLQ